MNEEHKGGHEGGGELREILRALEQMNERIHAIETATALGVRDISTSINEIATHQSAEAQSVQNIDTNFEKYLGVPAKAEAESRRVRHQRLTDRFWKTGGAHYPDVSEWYPAGATEADKDTIDARNALRERMYNALIFVFQQRFSFDAPNYTAEWFASWRPGQGAAAPGMDETRFLGVHGLLLADNYTDPLLLRPEGTTLSDDVLGEVKLKDWDGVGKAGFEPIAVEVRIARRFFDAAVNAVQRYTAKADLFARVREQLESRGKRGSAAFNRPASSLP